MCGGDWGLCQNRDSNAQTSTEQASFPTVMDINKSQDKNVSVDSLNKENGKGTQEAKRLSSILRLKIKQQTYDRDSIFLLLVLMEQLQFRNIKRVDCPSAFMSVLHTVCQVYKQTLQSCHSHSL